MKRFLLLLLVAILLFSVSIAYAADYSSKTDEQLTQEFDAIRNELVNRGLIAKNKKVLLDEKDIIVYINGDITVQEPSLVVDYCYLHIPIIVVNNSNKNIGLSIDNSSVNGWSVYGDDDTGTTPAGKKSKGKLYFSLEDIDEFKSINDFTDVEFSISGYNMDDWRYITNKKLIKLYGNEQ